MKKVFRFCFASLLVLAGSVGAAEATIAAPLPAVESVMERVVQQAEREPVNEALFEQRYSYLRTRITEHYNSRGEVKKREMKEKAHTPPTPLRDQPQPVLFRSGAAPQVPPAEGAGERTSKGIKKGGFDLDPELLRRFEFTMVGREWVDGRSALVMDFVPLDKKLPEQDYKDRFINRACGRVWVDEAEFVLIRVQLHLMERVNVWGGLLGAIWKLDYGFSRERTEDGLWFTRDVKWHLEGRKGFVPMTIDYRENRTDVRRVGAGG